MSIISKWLATAFLLAMMPIPSNATPNKLPLCSPEFLVVDASEQVSVRKLILNDDRLRVWVERRALANFWKHRSTDPLDERLGVGYELDGAAITGVQPLLRTSDLTVILSFAHLKSGHHRLRIGFSTPGGQLNEDNTYCFISPGKFTLTGQ